MQAWKHTSVPHETMWIDLGKTPGNCWCWFDAHIKRFGERKCGERLKDSLTDLAFAHASEAVKAAEDAKWNISPV